MTDHLRIRRVLLVAGCLADAEAALPLAVRLAALARAEITGVLAEDPAALNLPGHAIAPGHAAPVEITAERMLAAFQADARAFETRLARAAAQAALGWGFRREAGAMAEVLERLTRQEDVALVGYRRAMRVRGPIVALSHGAEAETVVLARTLARAMRLPLMLLSVGEAEAADTSASGETRLAVPDPMAALRALDTLAPTAVVLQADRTLFGAGPGLRALIETARCPVLLRSGAAPTGR
jgi:hypothetical protein